MHCYDSNINDQNSININNNNLLILYQQYKMINNQNSEINTQLQKCLSQWPEWIKQFEFDPVYGYLIDPEYHPVCFDHDLIKQILVKLHEYNRTGQIVEIVKNFPQIKINKEIATHRDMVILHDMCSYLTHSYIKNFKDKQINQTEIVLPKNLALPLVQSASFLKVKTGMATGIGYNWYFNEKPENLDNLTIQNITIKYFYSEQPEHEGLFFRVSVATSYFLARIIKNCYEMNFIITLQPNLTHLVLQRLRNVRFFLKKIFEANLQIQVKLDKQFFFYVLRIFVAGYQQVLFQGVNQRISSSGGAGGYDPSFQAFERAFGIEFEGELADIQKKLRNGMPEKNRNLIDFFADHSLIRDYCECTQELQLAYNETIEAYVKYLQLHGTFIKNFLIHLMPVNAARASFGATGATMIKIVDRYRFVREQQFSGTE